MRGLVDRVVELLVRLIVTVFFREIEVVGHEHLPRNRPLIVVANHINSLIDPLLLIGCLGIRPRLLAKSTLWQQPLLRPLFALAGVIPVHRRQDRDQGADTSHNLETFARCHELLAQGGAIALFPEGLSHSEPSLRPLRTGAARIAREAEQRLGPLGVFIVPVGLVFDAKSSFRSRVLLQIGEPIDPLAEPFTGPDDEPDKVRRLTDQINQALSAVTLNYQSWHQARLIERAADLWARPLSELPYDQPLADQLAVRQAFVAGMATLQARDEAAVAAVAGAVLAYDRLLTPTGLRDDQVASLYPRTMVLAFAWRSLLRLLLQLPIAAAGTVLNWLPYRLCAVIAARHEHLPDTQATYKVFPALGLYPLTWLLEAAAAALAAGPWAGLVMLLLAPVSGWVAALFHQRRERLAIETRAFLLLASHRRLVADLQAVRTELYQQIAALVERYEALTSPAEPEAVQ